MRVTSSVPRFQGVNHACVSNVRDYDRIMGSLDSHIQPGSRVQHYRPTYAQKGYIAIQTTPWATYSAADQRNGDFLESQGLPVLRYTQQAVNDADKKSAIRRVDLDGQPLSEEATTPQSRVGTFLA